MPQVLSRCTFDKHLAAAAALIPHTVQSQKSPDILIGHTGVTRLNADPYEAIRQIGLMEGGQLQGMVMSESDDLNASNPDPTPPHQLVAETVSYLKTIGVKLRT